MRTYTIEQQKTKLEKAIKDALIISNNELCVLQDYYMEENLRYVVMTEISKAKCFGVFPNTNTSGNLLCFEQSYPKPKKGQKIKFKPDIVSIKLRKNRGNTYSINKVNPLVIELKQNPSLGKIEPDPKPNLFEPTPQKKQIEIKDMKSSLSTDITKVRKYLVKNSDNLRFEIGAVVIVGTGKIDQNNFKKKLEQILVMHQKELKVEISSAKNLLFAWFNPLIEEPELIWLNKKEKIVLGTNKKK